MNIDILTLHPDLSRAHPAGPEAVAASKYQAGNNTRATHPRHAVPDSDRLFGNGFGSPDERHEEQADHRDPRTDQPAELEAVLGRDLGLTDPDHLGRENATDRRTADGTAER